MKNELQVKDITFEPSSAEVIASTLKFDASVKKLTIGDISGTTKLNGTLKNGKLHIDFSPFFDWGWGKKNVADDSALDEFRKKLKMAGLADAQVSRVIKLIENDLNNITGQTGDIEYVEESKNGIIGGTKCLIDQNKGGTDFNLPDFPLNLDMQLDVKDVSIDSVEMKADSQIITDNFQTSETTISGLDLVTEISLPFNSMEIDELSTPPVNVPRLDIPDLSTAFIIGEVTSAEIPLSLKSESGSADISLKKLVDWHPRWKVNIGFKVLWVNVGVWFEFGLDLTIDLYFKLLINFLDISLKLANLVLDGLSFTLKMLGTSIVNAKLGVLKIAKIIGKMLKNSNT